MSEFTNLADTFNNSKEFKPLVETVQTIMNLNVDELSPDEIENLQKICEIVLTPKIKQDGVASMIANFEENGYNRLEVIQGITGLKQEFNNYIDSLNPSPAKRKLLNAFFGVFNDIFDLVIEQYHNTSIKLPIMLEEGAQMPTYAHHTDAAADLYAMGTVTIPAHSCGNRIHTGVHIALPEGWMAFVLPRSNIGLKTGLRLSNSVGLIDEEYRGSVDVLYDNISDSAYTINKGDRIAQLLVLPASHFQGQLVLELPASTRGEGGFGSTGV